MKLESPVTKALLAERSFHIEFQGYLSNHAKHAIVALDKLDAPDDRIQEYWTEYTTLTPYNLPLCKVNKDWDKVEPCTLDQWKEWRGQKTNWQEQVAFMDAELHKLNGNTDKLVQTYAPELLSGIAGSLTHGIIHLGWAIDAQSPWMICEGLAYLNFCYLGVDETKLQDDQYPDPTPMDSLTRIAKTWESENLKQTWVEETKAAYDESFHPELVVAGFQWQLAKVLKDANPVATDLPKWLDEESIDYLWESMYRCVVALYLTSRDEQGHGNFVVLHLITSLWALEQVCRVVDSGPTMMKVTRQALKQYYTTMVCLMATGGVVPSVEALEQVQKDFCPLKVDLESFDWGPIVEKGIAETEEHNIKLVYVTRELWRRYGRWSGFSTAAQSFTLTPNIGPAKPEFSASQ